MRHFVMVCVVALFLGVAAWTQAAETVAHDDPRRGWRGGQRYPGNGIDDKIYGAKFISGHGDGEVWSAPIRVPGQPCEVVLNADGVGGINVEIADGRFCLLEGFSAKNAAQSVGSGDLDCKVQWPKKTFSDLAGRTVRLRINLRRTDNIDPHLYAVYLRT